MPSLPYRKRLIAVSWTSNTGRPYQKDFVLESGFIRRKLLFKNILSISFYEKALLLGLKTGKQHFFYIKLELCDSQKIS